MTESNERLLNRRIALGITGSIAAYKAIELMRMLQREGADVRVLMTNSAVEFVGTLTIETLSQHPVDSDVLALQGDGQIGHIASAHDVEAIVVAPATAHWLAAMASGLAGDTITAACLATSVPVVVGNPGQRGAPSRVRLSHRRAGVGRACIRHGWPGPARRPWNHRRCHRRGTE